MSNLGAALNTISSVSDALIVPSTVLNYKFTSSSDFKKQVYNPFSISHSQTHRFSVYEIALTLSTGVAWSSTSTVKLDVGDFVLSVYMSVKLPSLTTSSSTTYCAWIKNIGDNIMLKSTFSSASYIQIEDYDYYFDNIYREFYVPDDKRQGYNELIGQENKKILLRGTNLAAGATIISPDDIVVINPNFTTVDSVPGAMGGTVGLTATDLTPGFVLLGSAITATQTLPALDTIDQAYVAQTLEIPDSFGGITEGYDGLQTFKTTHASTTIYSFFKFWWTRSPAVSLALCMIGSQNAPEIKFTVRPFADMYVLTGTGATLLSTEDHTLTEGNIYARIATISTSLRQFFSNISSVRIAHIPIAWSQLMNSATSTLIPNFPFMSSHLYIIFHDATHIAANSWSTYCAPVTGAPDNLFTPPITNLKITIDASNTVFDKQEANSRLIQPFWTHNRIPFDQFIYLYSFALDTNYQPTSYYNYSASIYPSIIPTLNAAIYSGSINIKVIIYSMSVQYIRYQGGRLQQVFGT